MHSNYISGGTKEGEPSPPLRIKIVMACLRTILRIESQTVGNNPLRCSGPINPTLLYRQQALYLSVLVVKGSFREYVPVFSSIHASYQFTLNIKNTGNPQVIIVTSNIFSPLLNEATCSFFLFFSFIIIIIIVIILLQLFFVLMRSLDIDYQLNPVIFITFQQS